MMLRALRRTERGAWLLAVLILGAAWGPLLVSARPAGAGCATAAHACCCGHSGKACCCDGHRGAPAQTASLSRCGGGDLPQGLVALPPALLPPARRALLPLPARASLLPRDIPSPPSHTPTPLTPPPQAA